MKEVKISELKDKLSEYLRAAEAGEEVTVLDRNRPIAKIVPYAPVDELEIIPPKVPLSEVQNRKFEPPVDRKTAKAIMEVFWEERNARR